MDILHSYHDNLIKQINPSFFRNLIESIEWNQRMLAIKGPRGAGKTTLILQYIKYILKVPREQVLYITADHYWFYTHNLVETADEFYMNGGRYLFIDEVHKYPFWSRELKNIFDGYPELQIVFTSSSALDILKGEADLSRRVLIYQLNGLSFREYLIMKGLGTFNTMSLEDIVNQHHAKATEFLHHFQPLPFFKKYLQYGYLPIIMNESELALSSKLNQMINTVIDSDLAGIEAYSSGTAFKVKKLLGVIAESVPFKPNVAALARKLDVSRDSIYTWLSHLEKAGLLNLVHAEGKGISMLQKPEKIYLENTNLIYAMKPQPEIGTIRETFLLNQLKNAGLNVSIPEKGDFFVDNIYIEVGGKNKKNHQVKHYENYLIVADEIEQGFKNKIPLWMFGFLY